MTSALQTKFIVRFLTVLALYSVLGKIGVSLAIPPGYATLVWLPSGVALGAVLIWGWRMSFAVVLGSIIVNFSTNEFSSSFATLLQSLTIPAIIGIGAAFQALLGAWLLRRFGRFPSRLNDERSVLLFLFWGGVVSCLFNPIWSTTALLLLGGIEQSEFIVNATTWWAGDVVGVFVAAPLVLVWSFVDTTHWLKRGLTVTSAILAAFGITVLVVSMSAAWERQRLQLQFSSVADLAGTSMSKAFKDHTEILHYMEGFVSSSDNMTRADFQNFSQRFLQNFSGLQALSWNPYIYDAERETFEDSVRAEGFTEFTIVERDENGEIIPATQRDNYVSVKFIEPFEQNKSAFGFDVGSNKARRAAFENAIDKGTVVATQRITLVQESAKQFGVLAFMPVYNSRTAPPDIDTRRANVRGFMVAVFRGGDISTAALSSFGAEQFVVQLRDTSAPKGEQFLFENRPETEGIRVLKEQGLFGGEENLTTSFDIDFGGRNWVAEFFPSREYVATTRQQNTWLVMVAGLAITSMVGIFVLIVSGREERLNALVMDRTANLVKSERRLGQAQEIASMGNWEFDIENGTFWCSDEVLRIIGVKSVPERFAIDFLDDFLAADDRKRVRKQLRLESLLTGPTNFEHQLVQADGHVIDVIQHVELVTENGKPTKIAGTVQDISELRKLDRLKTEFVATVSHELRTPLTSIKGALGLLNGGVIEGMPPKAVELVTVAHANVERLGRLVDDLLDINGIMSGNLVLKPERVKLGELLQHAADLSQPYADQQNATISVEKIDSEVELDVDKNRLMQVLTNLLSNAAKFSANPGEIRVGLEQRAADVRVFVSDNGEGIPEDFKSKIFGRFSQADSSETRAQGGAGLGLFISKEIVDAMNGNIGFDDNPRGGTTFFVDLPMG
ncbi:CHASE domain-containing protein [Maritalea porphyrae]|uniref:CHASE domain-containing protein n=1 Tax=Maritalea porphyrae TaxID=880732 RepID=UPI0024E0DABD|nr:CHASE domain-containing protein [Maritalea porphyrae]